MSTLLTPTFQRDMLRSLLESAENAYGFLADLLPQETAAPALHALDGYTTALAAILTMIEQQTHKQS